MKLDPSIYIPYTQLLGIYTNLTLIPVFFAISKKLIIIKFIDRYLYILEYKKEALGQGDQGDKYLHATQDAALSSLMGSLRFDLQQ